MWYMATLIQLFLTRYICQTLIFFGDIIEFFIIAVIAGAPTNSLALTKPTWLQFAHAIDRSRTMPD
jgi:hypothetical protein